MLTIKRIIPLAVAAIIFSANCFTAFAEGSHSPSSDFSYLRLNDNTVKITYEGNDTHVVIPETIDGYTVTMIDNDAFCQCDDLESVKMPDTVTVIGEDAFSDCSKLSDIEFSSNLKELGGYSFNNCGSLKSVKLPPKVESIGNRAFSECLNLEEISIPDSVKGFGYNAFYKTPWLYNQIQGKKHLIINNVLVCLYSEPVGRYEIPNGVDSIGSGVFYSCDSLTELVITQGVTELQDYAVTGCPALSKVILPDSLEIIGNNAFEDCPDLKEINFPQSLRIIGDYAFFNDSQLKEFSIPNEIEYVGYGSLGFHNDNDDGFSKYQCKINAEKGTKGDAYIIENGFYSDSDDVSDIPEDKSTASSYETEKANPHSGPYGKITEDTEKNNDKVSEKDSLDPLIVLLIIGFTIVFLAFIAWLFFGRKNKY